MISSYFTCGVWAAPSEPTFLTRSPRDYRSPGYDSPAKWKIDANITAIPKLEPVKRVRVSQGVTQGMVIRKIEPSSTKIALL